MKITVRVSSKLVINNFAYNYKKGPSGKCAKKLGKPNRLFGFRFDIMSVSLL